MANKYFKEKKLVFKTKQFDGKAFMYGATYNSKIDAQNGRDKITSKLNSFGRVSEGSLNGKKVFRTWYKDR